jgi:hypothetical protein
MADEPQEWIVTKTIAANRQLRQLLEGAPIGNERRQLAVILKEMAARLERRPLEFGDPVYSAQKDGGKVHHALIHPISITFVAYELERVVCIFSVRHVAKPLS